MSEQLTEKQIKKKIYNQRYQAKLKEKLAQIEENPDASFFFHQSDHKHQPAQQIQHPVNPVPIIQSNQPSLLWKMGEVMALTVAPIIAKMTAEKLIPLVLSKKSNPNVGSSSVTTSEPMFSIPNF